MSNVQSHNVSCLQFTWLPLFLSFVDVIVPERTLTISVDTLGEPSQVFWLIGEMAKFQKTDQSNGLCPNISTKIYW